MARAPKDAEVLRFIAEKEPLSATLKAFPGAQRDKLANLLERLAESLGDESSTVVLQAPAEGVAAAPSGTVHRRLRVYSDGAARGNPGPAGAGAVLVDASGQVVDRVGKFLGVQTNNYAEYMAVLLGLQRARELGVKDVEVFADSELMIRQLGGRYQVKSPTLRPLYERAMKLLGSFEVVKLVHVPREMNTAADEMSNRAIDERL